jgi:hypothetical protein
MLSSTSVSLNKVGLMKIELDAVRRHLTPNTHLVKKTEEDRKPIEKHVEEIQRHGMMNCPPF